jgi:DNA-binding response OmpR family regulator
MQQNNIKLCGIGKQMPNNNGTLPLLVFNKIFTEPLNIDEIEQFLDDIMAAHEVKYERRAKERRRGDRRWDMAELIEHEATLVSIARHSYNRPDLKKSRRIGRLVIDDLAKTISVNGAPVEISPKEFQLIDLLVQQPGSVVKVEDIIQKVWPENKRATSADVHQYVYILRHKLEEDPHNPKLLLTVKGFGYKLCP